MVGNLLARWARKASQRIGQVVAGQGAVLCVSLLCRFTKLYFSRQNPLPPGVFKHLSDASEIREALRAKDTPRVCRARRRFKEKKNR
jgi:hypothetical protein